MSIDVSVVVSRMFDQNCYILGRVGAPTVVVVDPGFSTEELLKALNGKTVAAVLLTHGHIDHIAGVKAVKQAHPAAPIVIGRGDAAMLTDANLNLSGMFGMPLTSLPADRLLDDGETVEYAGLSFTVRAIPGHSPGHIVFITAGEAPRIVVGGDVLFAGSVGRTDFPGGSRRVLLEGIRAKLLPLPADTRVLPGHGPETTIGHEAATNPYLVDAEDSES